MQWEGQVILRGVIVRSWGNADEVTGERFELMKKRDEKEIVRKLCCCDK